ncbi:hypothetical protein J3F80_001721 [Coemansia sp. RSA 2526]|nr:hypothetical protein J3F80_001721 [Coemansia sp. RSA 2526]
MSMTVTELPHKEQALFRSALKLYEASQYKKGLKVSEQILKKFPDHGETLSVKGMFLAHLERKEEGYELMERGLKINPQSSISWHVYGLVCRSDKKYVQAIKCYEEALKADSENMHILREVASLYVQMRQYSKAVECREKLTAMNPFFPSFWLGLATAHHMNGRYDLAIKVISAHELGNNQPPLDKYMISELSLYKNWLIELNGDYQQALEHLKEIRPQIVDITGWKEKKARLLLKADRKEAAATAFQDLLERNSENDDYITGYMECNGLDMKCDEDQDAVLEVIGTLQQQFPSSNRLRFLPLMYSTGDNFVVAAESLAKYALRKGIPSLFSSVRVLYADKAKGAALGTLIESCATQIRDTKRFNDSTDDEPASVLLWCNYYLAQHYDYYGDHERALTLIEEAIRSSPKTIEPYMIKARILKHAGDFRGARDTMDYARQQDVGDRYLTTKFIKYMLRVDEVDEAEKTYLLFVNEDAPHKIQEIVNMQATWYMNERGHAYRRMGDIGRALKHYHQAISVFDTYQDDQYDFHQYSVRKVTLRSYIDILEWEATVYENPAYQTAARAAAECYLELADRKASCNTFVPIEIEKDDKPLTRNGSAQQGQQNLAAGVGETKVYDVEKDPNGTKFVESDNLAEALKLAEHLESVAASNPDTHVLAFEVHLRMQKYFLVLKAINALKAIDATHPALPSMVVRLSQALDTDESFAAALKVPLRAQLAKSFGAVDITTGTAESIDSVLAAAKSMLAMGNGDQAAALLVQTPEAKYAEGRTLLKLLEAKRLLAKSGADESTQAAFGASAKTVFPLATCF